MHVFTTESPATLEGVSLLRRHLSRKLRDLRFDSGMIDDLAIAVAELGANLVRHARPQPSRIVLTAEVDGSAMRIDLVDDGGLWTDLPARLDAAKRMIASRDAESGRGLMLVARAMDRWSLASEPEANRLTLWRRIHRRTPLVLLVEDDAGLLDVFTWQIGSACRVVTAGDVESAGLILSSMPVDCVVTDLHLGGESGNALVEWLERDPERPPVPIVVVTGDGDRAVQAGSLELGVERVLTKPVTGAELMAAIRTAMVRSARQRARLMRHFSAVLDSLLADRVPPRGSGFAMQSRSAAAALGGGDAVLCIDRGSTRRLVMLDAMGHGLGAKAAAVALVAMARTLETTVAPETCRDFITGLSALVEHESAMAGFVATALVLDVGNGRVSVASAGHPRPVLVSGGAVTTVAVSGPPLGLVLAAPQTETTLTLGEGDRLFVCSDGVDPFGLACGGPPPEWLVAPLAADGRSVAERADDLASLISETLGPDPEDDWSFLLLGPEDAAPGRRDEQAT